MTNIVLVGVREFQGALDAAIARKAVAARTAVAAGAHEIETEAKTLLTESSHPKGTPTPSMPGRPPSLVTGTLRRSIQVQGPTSIGTHTFQASIGPTAVYGRIQELGGVAGRGARLPARPYMQPAVEHSKPVLESLFREAWSTW